MDDEDRQYPDDDVSERDELDASGMRLDDDEAEGPALDPLADTEEDERL